jgi:hypothetical protein
VAAELRKAIDQVYPAGERAVAPRLPRPFFAMSRVGLRLRPGHAQQPVPDLMREDGSCCILSAADVLALNVFIEARVSGT